MENCSACDCHEKAYGYLFIYLRQVEGHEATVYANFKSRAEEAGILILGEMGLDPGLDHLTASKMIDEIGPSNITSFQSWCGGLPAPECTGIGNPLKYKFSWSPKGAFLALNNKCRFLLDGKVVEIDKGGASLDHAFSFSDFNLSRHKNILTPSLFPGFCLEGLANRDSLAYLAAYNLENCRNKPFI